MVNLDGGVFRVCNSCARLGTPARVQRAAGTSSNRGNGGGGFSPGAQQFGSAQRKSPRTSNSPPPPPSPAFSYENQDLVLREDYSAAIKSARELLGITQEELGHKINEKPSMVSHLENGTMKPDDSIARKLEHVLKLRLFVSEDEEIPPTSSA
jgi:ribosome-binding protein aMBF1 (putative translation factor)